jgi:flagellar protein FlaG
MLVEPINTPGKHLAPPAQTKPHSEPTIGRGAKENRAPQNHVNHSQLLEAATDVQRNLNVIHNVDLSFKVHSDSGKIMVTVKDETTGDVIREIPPAEILDLATRLEEMIGLIFDQKG